MGTNCVTLLTDFGLQDWYVAVMKGVILSLHPEAQVVDLSHAIEPGDVESAAFVLAHSVVRFPPGAVHVVVVDSGVGSARRALVVESDKRMFVAPDNGVLTHVLATSGTWRAWEITRDAYMVHPVSATFQGRDVFAPAGAHLARGVSPEEFGDSVSDPVCLTRRDVDFMPGGEVHGEVVYVDHFGNLITNIPATLCEEGGIEVRIGNDHSVRGLSRCYADGVRGDPVALIGSSGFLEISCVGDSLAREWDIGRGVRVEMVKCENA